MEILSYVVMFIFGALFGIAIESLMIVAGNDDELEDEEDFFDEE